MKEDILKIINHYKVLPQLKYFQSEVFELNEAIITFENGDCWSNSGIELNKEHIAEEIADVMVMLEQFRLYYDIPTVDIRKVMEYKVKRQIERIENESNRFIK